MLVSGSVVEVDDDAVAMGRRGTAMAEFVLGDDEPPGRLVKAASR